MTTEPLTIPWLKKHSALKIDECQDLGGNQLQITVSGDNPAARRAFEAQLTTGRTAVIHNGVTKHVGLPSSSCDQGDGRVTVIVTAER